MALDRPSEGLPYIAFDGPKLNAVTPDMHSDLADIWPVIDLDEAARAVLVRDALDRAFSAAGASS